MQEAQRKSGTVAKMRASFQISRQNLGERWHTASSEPFFYDTTYMPVQRDNAVPVDENGRCCTAEEVGDRDKNTMRP